MLEFLRHKGITDDVIKEIMLVNVDSNIYNLNCNQDEVLKIIDYLRTLNIECIDKLLIYRIDKFFLTFENFKRLFTKTDINNIVKLINEDYTVIDEL